MGDFLIEALFYIAVWLGEKLIYGPKDAPRKYSVWIARLLVFGGAILVLMAIIGSPLVTSPVWAALFWVLLWFVVLANEFKRKSFLVVGLLAVVMAGVFLAYAVTPQS